MKILIVLVFLGILSGCVVGCSSMLALPTVQNCADFTYSRHGADIDVVMTCKVPLK